MEGNRVVKLRHLEKVLVSGVLLFSVFTAQSAVVYESATLGRTGHSAGYSLSAVNFIGSRFELSVTTRVDSIGGHLAGSGTIWGAIFTLADAMTAFPDPGSATDPAGFSLAHAILDPRSMFSTDRVVGDLIGGSVALDPGAYAIVLGGGSFFGANSGGYMPDAPLTGSVNIGSPTYFFRSSTSRLWREGGISPVRFEVNGEAVPAPATLALLGVSIAGMGYAKRKRHRSA